MKGAKVIAIIIAIVLFHGVSYAQAGNPNYGEFYPRLSVVVDVCENVVICEDREGNQWSFFSDENEWIYGDICNLLMWNLSMDVTEHEVVEVYFEGYTDNIEEFFMVNNWVR